MKSNPTSVKHSFIYAVLVLLALLSVATPLLHLSAGLTNLAVFTIAFLMAALVVTQYMGLKWEGPLVYGIFLIPVVLFAILVVMLIPDIAHQPIPFLMEH